MSWSRYGDAKTLAPTFELGVACAKAGIPLLIVAPPSGGKSTIIFAVEKWLSEHGENVRRQARLGLRALKGLTEWLKTSQTATIVNEDFSAIGRTEYMTELMGEIIGLLSYSKTYQDEGLKIDLTMTKLGFVSGVQPLWIKKMMVHPVFATHIREKFLRYYELPYTPTKKIGMNEAIDTLTRKAQSFKMNVKVRIPPEFLSALSFQVGSERAGEYAPMIARELTTLMPKSKVWKALKFYAMRMMFEREFVERELSDEGFTVETKWSGFHALYWVLRKGRVTREEFMDLLGVTSLRSVDRALDHAIRYGWVTSTWNSSTKGFMPSEGMKRRVALK